jgi:hypothetical protein
LGAVEPLEPGVAGAVGAAGLVVLDPLPEEPLELPMPEEPLELPLPALSLRRHASRCAPVRPTHLLASPLDDPDAAPAAPEVLPDVELSLLPEDEPLAEGAVVLLPEDELPVDGVADGVLELPEAPAPVLPELEPEDCENAAPDSARSAAAVAAVRVFNIMRGTPSKGG